MHSLWRSTAHLPSFPTLKEDICTDVLIIGGGLSGLLCSYFLKQRGISSVVAEASSICSGASGNTTAKITSQHGLIYSRLIKEKGMEQAAMYLKANQQAIEDYRSLCSNIDCDFEEKSSFVYSLSNKTALETELKALEKLGFPAKLQKELPLPFKTEGAVEFPKQAQFHPLLFAKGIAKELTIYENTPVHSIHGSVALTDQNTIQAKRFIITTHFPYINTHGMYFLKLYQHRSYVVALKNAPEMDGMYIGDTENSLSFRSYRNFLLLGGGGHRTGKKGGNWAELRSFSQQYYPKAKEAYYWAAQDCMPLDGIPYVGQYSKRTPHIFTASGFQKWGMTSSMAAARILADMAAGKKNDLAPLFNPSRSIWKPQLFINSFEAAKNLLTPSIKRCPHMGCALKWNKAEHSWDCPCHGSRFEEDGKLIDNPATGNANIHPQA